MFNMSNILFLVACMRLYNPLCPSVGRSVGRSVGWWSVGRSHFTFFMILFFLPHCSCPNGLVTSNIAHAHPHATAVAVYPALFSIYNNIWPDVHLLLISRSQKDWADPSSTYMEKSYRCAFFLHLLRPVENILSPCCKQPEVNIKQAR